MPRATRPPAWTASPRRPGSQAHRLQPLSQQGSVVLDDPGGALGTQRGQRRVTVPRRPAAAGAAAAVAGPEAGTAQRCQLHRPARVAMAEIIHSPERAQAIVCRMGEKESGESARIRAAIADGRLREVDPEFAGHQLHGLVKSFAFWPQVTMGQAPLSAQERARVAESAVAMFLVSTRSSWRRSDGTRRPVAPPSTDSPGRHPRPGLAASAPAPGFRYLRPPRSRRSGARPRR